jgi:hypothetical protein
MLALDPDFQSFVGIVEMLGVWVMIVGVVLLFRKFMDWMEK